MEKRKILIAPDKFKGSLSAMEVCNAIKRGLEKQNKNVVIHTHPLADGGDGSLEVIALHLDLQKQLIETTDPLGRPIQACYYTNHQTAFIELAKASGLVLLQTDELNPLKTSTLGTGKMIAHAITKGCNEICLFLGGSATNDGGMGIAAALGVHFLDADQEVLSPIGENLIKVRSIKKHLDFDIEKVRFTLLCDVNNPLLGANGAAQVYARQKGADDPMIQKLDDGLRHFSEQILEATGTAIAGLPGSGAAGGIAASLVPLFNAHIESGIESFLRQTNLEAEIQQADLVISGEGSLDQQSFQGKVIDGVAGLCRKHNKPLVLFVGKNMLSTAQQAQLGIEQIVAVHGEASSLDDSMQNAARYLDQLAQQFQLNLEP